MPELIHGQESIRILQDNENKRLHDSLKELFTKKRKLFRFDEDDDEARVGLVIEDVIAKEIFDGRLSDTLRDEERGPEGHVIGKIEINNEPQSLVVKYYLDNQKFKPWLDSVKLQDEDTIYA
jgi:hypothetical protein